MSANRVRRLYEKHPYPGADEGTLTDTTWRFAPMEWIAALWKPGLKVAALKRILVAGCGTGREAFSLRRQCPQAEILGVDFSPRSITIARELQRRSAEMRSIRFVVADLLSRTFARSVGRDFDFISCHGVLSYLPVPGRVLKNLGRCLRPDGALYLGVNGSQHSSVGGREFLSAFGLDMTDFRESPCVRRLLKLSDAILGRRGSARLSSKTASYLGGDLFGPLILNLPISDWVATAREAGFHFHGSYSCWPLLRVAMEKDYPKLLMPKSRPELCEVLESLCPAGFHRLLFTPQRPRNPPWENHESLLEWRPVLTGLYTHRLPTRLRSGHVLRAVTFKSAATNTRLEWQMPEWEVALLRQSDGSQTVRELLQGMQIKISPRLLREQLYVLHQLAVICLQPRGQPG